MLNMHASSKSRAIRYTAAVCLLTAALWCQAAEPDEAAASADPVKLGIMQGFPPPQDKLVTKENAFRFPNLRWSLRNTRLIAPTANVGHSSEPWPLPSGNAAALDNVRFAIGGRTLTLADYLRDTYTDGFIVVSRGKIVYERYFDSFRSSDVHAWASMAKSMTGLVAARLIAEGRLDPQAPLARYVPELADTPLGAATIQQNLDMEVPVTYPPGLPPDLGLFGAVGIAPRRDGAPNTIYDFLKVTRATPGMTAGQVWFYQNGSPEAVAWALCRIAGRSWSELVADDVWRRIAGDDAYVVVDRVGIEMASGGLHTTLRDAARFAEFVRSGVGAKPQIGSDVEAKTNTGSTNDAVEPMRAAIHVALKPADNAALFAQGNFAAGRAGYSYHDYWYQTNDGDGSFVASGRFGQAILIDPKAALSIVKFSSSPDFAPRAQSAGAQSTARPLLERADALQTAARAIAAALAR
ncbi:6-aminohexanoate hydrolase [Burkholderia singularis]|nr:MULTISPECIES: serine hydrolase [unclassified Burkholderia]AOK32370.1 6-aminohexanoate hydrolase [Burkholderia sp. Bp7605]